MLSIYQNVPVTPEEYKIIKNASNLLASIRVYIGLPSMEGPKPGIFQNATGLKKVQPLCSKKGWSSTLAYLK